MPVQYKQLIDTTDVRLVRENLRYWWYDMRNLAIRVGKYGPKVKHLYTYEQEHCVHLFCNLMLFHLNGCYFIMHSITLVTFSVKQSLKMNS